MYIIKVGEIYFSGFEEKKGKVVGIMFAFAPAYAKIYDNLEEAKSNKLELQKISNDKITLKKLVILE